MTFRALAALPVHNEVRFVDDVLDEVTRYCADVLVVDDGSTDGTGAILAARNDVAVVTHRHNRAMVRRWSVPSSSPSATGTTAW